MFSSARRPTRSAARLRLRPARCGYRARARPRAIAYRTRSRKRGTRLVMGNALVARLFYSLRRRNVAIAYNARLVELVRANAGVDGAVVDIGDARQTIRARHGVILATGGFAPNEKLRAEFMS